MSTAADLAADIAQGWATDPALGTHNRGYDADAVVRLPRLVRAGTHDRTHGAERLWALVNEREYVHRWAR